MTLGAYQEMDALLKSCEGRIVLVRTDLNIPLHAGRLHDTTRLVHHKETLNALARAGARVVVVSHFGRPHGVARQEFSLRPVAEALGGLLKTNVAFAPDCIGETARDAVAALAPGDILVLENTRFHKGEEKNDTDFAAALAELGDVYVNDAFSVCHRAHASVAAIAQKLPAYAGHSLMRELKALCTILKDPSRPLLAIVGGAKISGKMEILESLTKRADMIAIGGAMAHTCLAAEGAAMGRSLYEPDMIETARRFLDAARRAKCPVFLPDDLIVAPAPAARDAARSVNAMHVPEDMMSLDIGPKTRARFQGLVAEARTIIWNGPLGLFETPPFDEGTKALARAVAEATRTESCVSLAGGGETGAALHASGVADDLTHLSSGGGALLEWLRFEDNLPGLAALALPYPDDTRQQAGA